MRFRPAPLLLFLVLAFTTARAAVPNLDAISVTITMSAFEDDDISVCTASVVGPSVILTATHCEVPDDGIRVNGLDATVVNRVRDGKGHTFLFLSGLKPFNTFAKACDDMIDRGGDVFIMGHPGDLADIYRRGTFSGWAHKDLPAKAMLFDLTGWHGDSGAGVFSQSGCLVGVVGFGLQIGEGAWPVWFLAGYPLEFTSAQYTAALKFVPPPVKKSADVKDEKTLQQLLDLYQIFNQIAPTIPTISSPPIQGVGTPPDIIYPGTPDLSGPTTRTPAVGPITGSALVGPPINAIDATGSCCLTINADGTATVTLSWDVMSMILRSFQIFD
jgi:hypothetical protein